MSLRDDEIEIVKKAFESYRNRLRAKSRFLKYRNVDISEEEN